MNVAVVVPALPSVTVTSSIDRVGGASSSVIVPAPWPSAIVALAGLDRSTENVSLASSSRSPLTATVNVCVVCPAANVSVPLAGRVVAPGRSAVPSAVAQSTVTVLPLARRQRDGERGGRGAGVALGHGDVVDRQRRQRVVVGDRAAPWRRRSWRWRGWTRPTVNVSFGLVEQVAVDRDGDRLAGLRRARRSACRSAVVVRPARRRVPSAVRAVDRDRPAAGGARA